MDTGSNGLPRLILDFDVRFGSKVDTIRSLHRPEKAWARYGSAHRFRGLEIDQLILGRRLHGHVGRSAAVQSSVSWKMLGVRVSFDVFAPLWMQ
jgi:hypothetical protein